MSKFYQIGNQNDENMRRNEKRLSYENKNKNENNSNNYNNNKKK